jgi:hypothetical protein
LLEALVVRSRDFLATRPRSGFNALIRDLENAIKETKIAVDTPAECGV